MQITRLCLYKAREDRSKCVVRTLPILVNQSAEQGCCLSDYRRKLPGQSAWVEMLHEDPICKKTFTFELAILGLGGANQNAAKMWNRLYNRSV